MPLFMEHGSTVPYGLVWAFNGECILNAVATQFTLNILDGRRLVLAYVDYSVVRSREEVFSHQLQWPQLYGIWRPGWV